MEQERYLTKTELVNRGWVLETLGPERGSMTFEGKTLFVCRSPQALRTMLRELIPSAKSG